MSDTGANLARIHLGNVGKGAAFEAFERELALVAANIADTLRIDFEPADDRVKVDVTVSSTARLAGVEPRTGEMYLGPGLVALEDDPRQMALWPPAAGDGNAIEFSKSKKDKGDRA